ncbi:MAG TPA: hypothetical protein VHL31_22430 [Geminicoccus sp.]|uniref:hypothetical protein n=1 Tax=Geminicoccus sp. TaxID=2024832 RepID=UPI002E346133|nr:hypothetical protein [Geminicoccus sp.]HEX2529040.1 hypothetical protein [Geminicoccus sp.]
MAGNDQLIGGAGSDRLDGGMGSDSLKGGESDDTYLLRRGDGGIDRITDGAGHNTIELQGVDFKDLSGWKVGHDLWLAVDTTPLGVVEDWDSGQHAWSIKTADRTVSADDMFS